MQNHLFHQKATGGKEDSTHNGKIRIEKTIRLWGNGYSVPSGNIKIQHDFSRQKLDKWVETEVAVVFVAQQSSVVDLVVMVLTVALHQQ